MLDTTRDARMGDILTIEPPLTIPRRSSAPPSTCSIARSATGRPRAA